MGVYTQAHLHHSAHHTCTPRGQSGDEEGWNLQSPTKALELTKITSWSGNLSHHHPFKVPHPVDCSAFTELCSHQSNFRTFRHLKSSLVPAADRSPLPPPRPGLGTTDLLSVSTALSVLDTSEKWNDIACGPLCCFHSP